MQTTLILLLTTHSGLHVLHYAIFLLICLESTKLFCSIRWLPSLLLFFFNRMELLPLSLFMVFNHRHLGHKQQVNQIKQQVIINNNYGHELWLCAILLYGKKRHENTMKSLLQLQVLAC